MNLKYITIDEDISLFSFLSRNRDKNENFLVLSRFRDKIE